MTFYGVFLGCTCVFENQDFFLGKKIKPVWTLLKDMLSSKSCTYSSVSPRPYIWQKRLKYEWQSLNGVSCFIGTPIQTSLLSLIQLRILPNGIMKDFVNLSCFTYFTNINWNRKCFFRLLRKPFCIFIVTIFEDIK